MDNISSTSIQVPRHIVYGHFLRNKKDSIHKLKPGVFTLLDCDDIGKLKKKHVIVEYKLSEGGEIFSICSCGEALCLHVQKVNSMERSPGEYNTEETEFLYKSLTEKLIAVYCDREQSYSVLHRLAQTTRLSCAKNIKKCSHICFHELHGRK